MCEQIKIGIAWDENIKMSYPRWSITCGETCPFKTPACLKECYGMKAYRVYTNTLQHDKENLDFTKREDFVERMIESLTKEKPTIFRIHERGDFYSVGYFKAWCSIAKACPDTQFFGFTKSFHLFKLDRPANLILIASMFHDEKRKRPSGVPAFYTVQKGSTGPGTHCHGGCDACGICPYADKSTTVWSEVH